MAGTPQAKAGALNWDNEGGDLLWATPANWDPGQVPTSADDLTFGSAGGAGMIDLGATLRTVQSLNFTLNGFTLGLSSAEALKLETGSVTVASGVTALINATLSSPTNVGFSKHGGGTLVVTSVAGNTVSGGLSVQGGTLKLAPVNDLITITGASEVQAGASLQLTGLGVTHNGALNNAGLIQVKNGTMNSFSGATQNDGVLQVAGVGTIADFGSKIITSTEQFIAGLREGRLQGTGINTTSANPLNFGVQLEPRMGQISLKNTDPHLGWGDNETWVYTGQFYDADGHFSFAENIDDAVLIRIDGVQRLTNGSYNTATTTGSVDGLGSASTLVTNVNPSGGVLDFGMGPKGDGWHTLEIRFYNGGGGAGPFPLNGWTSTYGFGLNTDGTTSANGADYFAPVDDGSGSLFRTYANIVQVEGGATLKAGGFTKAGQIVISGDSFNGPGVLELTAAHTSDVLELASAGLGILQLGSGSIVNADILSLPSGRLTIAGSGTVNVANGSYGSGVVVARGGTLNFNGTASTSPTLNIAVGAGSVNFTDNASIGGLSSEQPGAVTGVVATPAGKSFTINGTGVYTGALNVNGSFHKSGTGIQFLGGKVTTEGSTEIDGGTLWLANLQTGAGASTFSQPISVLPGGALQVGVDTAGGGSGLGTNAVNLDGGTLRIGPLVNAATTKADGVVGSYFSGALNGNNTYFGNFYNTPAAQRLEMDGLNFPGINLAANVGTAQGTPTGVGNINGTNVENFHAMWNGLLEITEGGVYNFNLPSDDGSVLYIDGVPVVLNEGSHGAPGATPNGSIGLTAGLHTVHLRLVQGGGGASLAFNYSGPDQETLGLVPSSRLFHVTNGGGNPASLGVTFANTINVGEFTESRLDASGANTTITGAINLAGGSLLNLGSSTYHQMTLSGSINYTGGALDGAARIAVPATSINLPTMGFNPTIAGTLTFNVADGQDEHDLTVEVPLLGAGNITKTGAGVLQLAGSNAFTGTVNLNGGLFSVVTGGEFGNAANPIVMNGGGMQNTSALTIGRSITLTGAGGVFDTRGGLTLTTPIGGDSGLTKTGPGVLNLPAGSTFGGAGKTVTFGAGTVIIGADSALGNAANSLTFNGGSLRTSGEISTSRAITVGTGGGALDVAGQASILTLNGPITGTGALAKNGAGTLRSTATTGAPLGNGAIAFNSGTIELAPTAGAANVALTSTGTLSYSGRNTLVLNKNGNTSLSVTMGGITRSGKGTLLLAPASGTAALGSATGEKLISTGGAPLVNGIVSPSILARDNDANGSGDFLTYGANGFTAATYTGLNSASATEVAAITSATTLSANETAHALKIGAAALTIGAGNTLSLGDGTSAGLILNGGSLLGGTLAFGGAESIIYTSLANGTISSNITGTGGLTKLGAGRLTLSGSTAGLSGGIRINAGTLAADVSGGTNPFGAQAITLNGGTVAIAGTMGALTPGLLGTYFNNGGSATSQKDYNPANYLEGQTASRIESTLSLVYSKTAPPEGYLGGNPGLGVGTDESTANTNIAQFAAQFTGMINIPTAGPQTFAILSDDGSRLFIDGVLVLENDGGQGGTTPLSTTLNLAAGYHDIRLEYIQGTGGANVRLFTPFGPSIRNLFVSNPVTLGNEVNVASDSAIDVTGGAFSQAKFGALTFAPGTALTVNGESGKTVNFASTTASSPGVLTIGGTANTSLGEVNLPGSTIIKQGASRLILDNTTGFGNDLTGASFDVQGGKLVAVGSSVAGSMNPLGGAAVTLNGGGLVLDSKFGNSGTATAFDNTVNVLADARIEVVPANSLVTLAGGGNRINIAAGTTLTTDVYSGGPLGAGNQAGPTLRIDGPLSGAGNLIKTASTIGDLDIISLNRNPGILILNADSPNYSGTTTINGGRVQVNGIASANPRGLGTGTVVLNASPLSVGMPVELFLKSNGTTSNGTITFGNNVILQGNGTSVLFDVNRIDGSNANNILAMGSLTVGGRLNTIVVNGANAYSLGFNNAAALTLPASPIDHYPGAGFTIAGNSGLILPMNVTLAGTLAKTGTGTLTLGGANTLGGLAVRGGAVAFTNPASIPATGVIVNGGGLIAAGANGSFAAGDGLTNAITPSFGSAFGIRFDNTIAVNANRWGDNVAINLNGTNAVDSLSILGNPLADVTETIGNLTFHGGTLIGLRPNFANRSVTIAANQLTRTGKGTIEFGTGAVAPGAVGGTLGTTSKLLVATAPARFASSGNGMVSPTIVNASTNNFVDYDVSSGFRDVTYDSTDLNSADATAIVNTGAVTLTSNRTVLALKATGNITPAAGADTITITGAPGDTTAGFIFAGSGLNVGTSKLIFGSSTAPREAVIMAQAGNVTIDAAGGVTANDLTKMGSSILLLRGDNTRTNTGGVLKGLEGVITINRGGISLRSQNAVGKGGSGIAGSGTSRIVLAGGILETRLNDSVTYGAGSGGAAYDITIAANSIINPDRDNSGTNQTSTFGNLSFSNGADTLTIQGSNGFRTAFTGTAPITLQTNTTFDVRDPGNSTGGGVNSGTALSLNGLLTDGGAGYSLTKTNGGKMQTNTKTNPTFGGGTFVTGGSLVWGFDFATAPATAQFGSGPITISGGGNFAVYGNTTAAGGAAVTEITNPVNVMEAGGGLYLLHNNANQTLRWTGAINLGGPLNIGNAGGTTAGANVEYGTIGANLVTIDQQAPGLRAIFNPNNKAINFNGNIVDGPGTAGNELVLASQSQILNILGTANTYSGGTRIIAGTSLAMHSVEVGAASVLGTGNVIIEGGQVIFNAVTNVNTAGGAKVTLQPGFGAAGLLTFRNFEPTQAELEAMISPASRDSILSLGIASGFSNDLDMARIGNGTLFLGAHLANTTYQASTLGVGAGGVYRLGGGYNQLTIANPDNNILTGANSLQIGTNLINGGFNNASPQVILLGANNFTGGTTVDFASGTLNVNGKDALGTGSLTTYSGITNIAQPQSISGVHIYGGTVNVNAAGGLGSTTDIDVGAGTGLSVGPTLAFANADYNFNALKLAGNTTLRPVSSVRFSGPVSYTRGMTLTINGTNGLVYLSSPTVTGNDSSVNVTITGGALALNNLGQLPGGNLNINGGVFVLNNTTWDAFLASRSGGMAASGPGTWQFNSGGFAARGTAVTLSGAAFTASSFDRNVTLGSAGTVDGVLHANASVTVAQDTTLTGKRIFTVAATGPGLTRASNAVDAPIYTFAGNLSGAGVPVIRSTGNGANDGAVGELVLSGKNTWTGSATYDIDGGSNVNWFSTGPGGLLVTTDANPGVGGDAFVRFASPASLPSGNGGATSYLFANRYGNATARQGFLLTGSEAGETYQLGTGYKFLLSSINNLPAGFQGSTLGSTGGNAILQGSAVSILSGNTSGATNVDSAATLLVRDGTLTLGSTASPVSFQPSNLAGQNNAQGTADPGLTAAATTLTDSTGKRTLYVRGMGTLAVGGVTYDTVNGSGDTSSQFSWQVGVGTVGVADGFVRELSSTLHLADAVADNLSNSKVTLNGGVIEFASAPRPLLLGTNIGDVNLSTAAGGGFAAKGGQRVLDVNAGGDLFWGESGFVGGNAPLIFGSPSADNAVKLPNNIDITASQGTIAGIRGVGNGPVAELSGTISGDAGSALHISGIKRPDGIAYDRGAILLSGDNLGFEGTVHVDGGILHTINNLGGLVEVTGAGALGGNSAAGTSIKNVTLGGGDGGGTLGNGVGKLNIGQLTFAGPSTLAIQMNGTAAGTEYTQIAVSGSLALDSTVALSLKLGYQPQEGDLFTIILKDGVSAFTGSGFLTYNGNKLVDDRDFLATDGAYSAFFRIDYNGGTGNDITLLAVPEPTGAASLLFGLGSLMGLQRFRRRKNA